MSFFPLACLQIPAPTEMCSSRANSSLEKIKNDISSLANAENGINTQKEKGRTVETAEIQLVQQVSSHLIQSCLLSAAVQVHRKDGRLTAAPSQALSVPIQLTPCTCGSSLTAHLTLQVLWDSLM